MQNIKFEIPVKVTEIIEKYFQHGAISYKIFFTHVVKVTELSLNIIEHNPHLNLNRDFIITGSMLHDIGIIKTKAHEIGCYGTLPYIAHTYIGRKILEKEGLPDIAPVCERHLGVGLSKEDIIESGFPLPIRDMMPVTLEEKLICYADKFYSKSEKHLTIPKKPEKIRKKLVKYGKDKQDRFEDLVKLFGIDYIFE